jgi:hypothetical protein
MFDKLNAIGPKGGWVGSASKSIGNFMMRNTVGRGAGALGWAGRNTIGRGVGKIGSGLTSRFASNDVRLTNRVNNASNPASRFGWQTLQQLNNFGQGRAKSIEESRAAKGTYDGRGTLAGEGKFASAVKKATGSSGDELGKGFDKGYADEDKARQEARSKEEDDRTKRTKDSIEVSDKEKESAYADSKNALKFKGVDASGVSFDKLKISEMDEILKDAEERGDVLKSAVNSAISSGSSASFVIGGRRFTEKEAEKIVNDTVPNSMAELVETAKGNIDSKLLKDRQNTYEASRTKQKATGGTRTILGDSINLPNRMSGATSEMEEKAQKTVLESARKKAKEEQSKLNQRKFMIESQFVGGADRIEEYVKRLTNAGITGFAPDAAASSAIATFKADVPRLADKDTSKGDVDNFDKDKLDDLFNAKKKILQDLNRYMNVHATTMDPTRRNRLKGDISRAISDIDQVKEKYQAITKPADVPKP